MSGRVWLPIVDGVSENYLVTLAKLPDCRACTDRVLCTLMIRVRALGFIRYVFQKDQP